MGLCLSFDCGDCEVCFNPCCLALGACCLVPCLCPNACGQQQPQTVHVHHPPTVIQQPPETIHVHHAPVVIDQGYPPPPDHGYPGYPPPQHGYPPPQHGYPPPQHEYQGYPQYR